MRSLCIGLTVMVAVLLAPWHPVVEPAPLAAAGLPFSVTHTALMPSPMTAGASVSIEARVKARLAGSASIETLITGSDGAVAWQTRVEETAFRRSQTRIFSVYWDVPADQPSGDYLLTVRVLDGDGVEVATSALAPFAISAVTPSDPPPTPGDLEPDEAAFLALINDYRQAHGLAPLTANPRLTAASEWMSWDMATKGYVSHTDSLGRDPFQRMADFDYAANTWKGENIAAGHGTAAQVFEGWRASAGHDANMLNANFTVIGIGRAYRPGSHYGAYWTTDFGGE